jgi:nitrogen fixation/metabolism regulation signal transduction histidine kinase
VRSFLLTESGLRAEAALEVTAPAETERNLAWTHAGGILSVALLAFLAGILLARRISSPLAQLATATTAMSFGS